MKLNIQYCLALFAALLLASSLPFSSSVREAATINPNDTSDVAQFGRGAQGGGGSSLQGSCYGGQCGGQGGYGGGQGGYGGGQGGCGGGQGGYPGGGQGGASRGHGRQGGSKGQGGFVEPVCGELGCCYYTHGFCARCCDPWWVPPGGNGNQAKPEKKKN